MSAPDQFGNYNPPPAFRQSRDPAATDDASKRVAFGSLWVNPLSSKAFICADPIIGGAVWYQIAPAGGGGSGPFLALEDATLAPEKISAMTIVTVPPAAQGTLVAVVVPGDATNYASPISTLLNGAAGDAVLQGESFTVTGGVGNGSGGGNVSFNGGVELTAGISGGAVFGIGGDGNGGGGGPATLYAGRDSGDGKGGDAGLVGGNSAIGLGGDVNISAGNTGGAGGGSVYISPGMSATGQGGSISLSPGTGAAPGNIVLQNLPIIAPLVSGALWVNAGVLSIVP